MSRGLRRTVVCAIGAAVAAALVPSVGQAWSLWTTNHIELDSGTCGQMLAIGSDQTASSSATPSFTMEGDGGMPSYAMAIDGVPIGTFTSAGRGIVCITAPTPLADGPHLLTGAELSPRPSMAVPAFAFSVDTVAPTPPSSPSLDDFSDSGVRGDGITKFGMVSLSGTADRGDRVQIARENGAVVAGTTTDASGHWSATTLDLPDGTYTLSAFTLDRAGNKSTRSSGMRLVVDSVAPATPGAPSLASPGQDARTVVSGTAGDDVATVVVYVGGTQFGTATPDGAHTWRFMLPALDPGSYSVTVVAADLADNYSARSAPLTVTISPPPPPAAAPPPPEPAPTPPPAAAPPVTAPPVTTPPAAGPIVVPPPAQSPAPSTPPASDTRPAPPDSPLPDVPRPPPPRRVP
jgi:hypothetical protein